MTRLEFKRRTMGLSQTSMGQQILYGRNAISWLETVRPSSDKVNVRLKAALERFFEEPFDSLMRDVEEAATPETGAK